MEVFLGMDGKWKDRNFLGLNNYCID